MVFMKQTHEWQACVTPGVTPVCEIDHCMQWRASHADLQTSYHLKTVFNWFQNGDHDVCHLEKAIKKKVTGKLRCFFTNIPCTGEQAHLSTPASSPVARSFSPSAQVFPARRSRPRERARKISGTKGSRVTYSPELKSPSNQYPLENCCFPIAAHTETTLPDWIYLSPLYLFEKQ